jgi:integrase/recombinase XerD
MNARQPTELGRCVMRFFQDYLPTLRGMSLHTIRSYRDGLVLLLQFVACDTHRRVESLEISDLSAERVGRFLKSLETERNNGIATRNARLAAIHTFARFLIAEHPERMEPLQRIVGIPFKRGAREAPVEYLEKTEIEALLDCIDRTTWAGQRDYALFALMINTGARVQEILDLRVCDLRLDPPHQVRLHGKGNKVRLCPIWPRTAQLLRELVSAVSPSPRDLATQPVFVNRHGAAMTRFGVRYLLGKHVSAAGKKSSTLANKRIHPHSLRHTTAICLLKAGIDFPTVSQWLGHATLNVTMRYTRADLDLKRQALAQVFPDALAPPTGGAYRFTGADLTGWLRQL